MAAPIYRKDLTVAEARAWLVYDPVTGDLRWRKTKRYNARVGELAGSAYNGYRWVVLSRVRYAAHRLAWLIHTGAWPTDQIDHIDMDRGNNRFVNLREADRTQNNANRRKVLTHQLKGVTLAPRCVTNPWVAQIGFKGKHYNLGYYPTEQAAHNAYVAAADRLFREYARAE